MTIEKKIKDEVKYVSLAKATDNEKKTIEILKQPLIKNLVDSIDTQPVVSKLNGARMPLSSEQTSLVVITKNMELYQSIIGAWLRTKPDEIYAIEHVLEYFDPFKNSFAKESRGVVSKLSFEDLQTLKTYSGLKEQIDGLYQKIPGPLHFSKDASTIARMLIGRSLYLPHDGNKDTWKKFSQGKLKNYTPMELEVIEAEGFETKDDVTSSRFCMMASPGQIDVMPFRGQYFLNIGTQEIESASCVMIRAGFVNGEIVEGPGRIGKYTHAKDLVGMIVRQDVTLGALSKGCGYIPGRNDYSVGRFRRQ